MRILNVTAQKPNSTGSGVYLTELVKEFEKMGHIQGIVAGIDKNEICAFDEKIKFYPVRFNTEKLPFNVVGMSDSMPYASTKYNQLSEDMANQFEKEFINICKIAVKELNPDVIICHHLYFLTALIREYFPDRKVIGISHGTDLRQYLKTDLQRDRIKENIQKLDFIGALHSEQKEEISEIFDISKDKISVIGTGYNKDIFKNLQYDKSENIIDLIFAGKLSYKKGVYSLIKAMNNIKTNEKYRLFLAGGYSDKAEYDAIVKISKEVNYDVKFLGKLNQKDMAEAFNKSHIMVLPSFFEGLPLVILESLACGAKVVATDLPGVQGWIKDNISNSGVVFVQPPIMKNVDEPIDDELVLFENRLTKVLETQIENYNKDNLNLENVSWECVAKRVINEI